MIDLVGDRKKCYKFMIISFFLGIVVMGIAWSCGAYPEHPHIFLEKPGGMVGFSFIGCWVLIILAKLIMSPLLQRDEDYYQKGNDDPDA